MSKWFKTSAGKRQECLCLREVSVVVSVVVVVVCVRCGVARSKRAPVVHSKRHRVYQHHAHMLKHMCAWCWYTRGRFACHTPHTPTTTPTQRDTETDRERARKRTEKEEREETTRGGRKDRTLTFQSFLKPLTCHIFSWCFASRCCFKHFSRLQAQFDL